jgi:hypothetical protein
MRNENRRADFVQECRARGLHFGFLGHGVGLKLHI